MSATEVKDQAKEMICIACPLGCRMTVHEENSEIIVKGNKCPRGKVYGQEEYLAPKRMVTCTVATNSEEFPRLPVRTTASFPKEKIDELLAELYKLEVKLPVKVGHTLIKDVHGSGVDVIATMSLPARR